MELKLVVVAGAKSGTQIPLNKDEFIIGRAKECALRVGSEAISRRHCLIARQGDSWSVRDLGSRNGTYVNEVRTAETVPLRPGDELRVGPLKFHVETADAAAARSKSTDIARGKQPPVKDVADVAQRTVGKSDDGTSEEDISRWLLGALDPKTSALTDTRTIRMEETTRIDRPVVSPAAPSPAEAASSNGAESTSNVLSESGEPTDDAKDKSGSWSWRKKGKVQTKQKPGKLPPRSSEPSSKDSREAAADILREMTRRR